MGEDAITINRAPVLTLWAAVVAERMGWDWDCALTLGKAMAGLQAQAKGRMLGIYSPARPCADGAPAVKSGLGEEFFVQLCGRSVPALHTESGPRACVKDAAIEPGSVVKYLQGKFGPQFDAAADAMRQLAAAYEPEELAGRAFGLYEQFRPEIQRGRQGWGSMGELDLAAIRAIAERRSQSLAP
ncbi:MAG TPA: hypothetical protein DEP45_01330 [Armatimonadetes bacterium]|nr:hypothetical protein [Armatimonadota bacterium]